MRDQHTQAGEAPFGFDELFFSRTDDAGRILFGNGVFRRVSDYSWNELVGAPHKIIRHPDMPRAVFWLLWKTIKQGEPIGAYVKNRAKDGRFYWVYAIVTPIEGGFLSVRLKPSAALFDATRAAYEKLTAAEKNQALTPADSAGVLGAKLAELGYEDYTAFMAATLAGEIISRSAQLGRNEPFMTQFMELVDAAKEVLTRADAIAEAYVHNANVPVNFHVLAAQLGKDGAAIGVISTNYRMLSGELHVLVEQFAASAANVARAIHRGLFLACVAQIQREVALQFSNEEDDGPLPRAPEIALLQRQQRQYSERARAALVEISRTVAGFVQACFEMNRLAAGLEVMRVMGKMECAHHLSHKERMDELLRDLEQFQKTVSDVLKQIDRFNHQIQRRLDSLLAA